MVNYIGIGGAGQIGSIKPIQPNKNAEKTDEAKGVQFESALQNVGATQDISSTTQTARAEKVAALKAQVEAGQYQPDMEKVSSSLLKFLVEER